MLVLSSNVIPQSLSLFFIASAASLHGLAHGAEAPESGLIDYAMGFMFTTAMLHLGGMEFGKFTHNTLAGRSTIAIKGIGAMLGLTGLMLFSQI
jgi:urease accessory protein